MKKNILSILLLSVLGSFCLAQGPAIVIEEIPHAGVVGSTDLTGFTSYRLYAQLTNADDLLSMVYGEEISPLSVNTTTSFYQSPFGGTTGSDVNEAFFPLIPESEWDSYVTVGSIGNNNVGIPLSEDPNGLFPVDDLFSITTVSDSGQPWEATFDSGSSFDISTFIGGAWFSIPTSANGYGVGVNNSVLLGQFTTDGALSFCLNIQVFDGENNDLTYTGLCEGITLQGCGDETACNYNANAEPDNSLCTYEGDTCDDNDAETANDTLDENCICSGDISGCTDEDASNYNPDAVVDNGGCIFSADACEDAQSIVVDGDAVEGDNTGASDENMEELEDCWLTDGDDGDVWFSFEGTGGLVEIETLNTGTNNDTQIALYDACGGSALACDDDSGQALMSLISGVCTEIGVTYYVEVEGWNGIEGSFSILVRSSNDLTDIGCSDSAACNFDPEWTCAEQNCLYVGDPCDDSNFNTVNDTYNDNCGCSGELNGCIDIQACNYNQLATTDDGSCIYPGTPCDDMDGTTINDMFDDNCNCEGSLSSCTDSDAINFNENAVTDDGSCIYNFCDDEPLSLTYCYEQNDSTQWVFEENYAGEGVIISFLEGSLEEGWDFINVYEGDSNTPLALNVEGDLSGLVFQTTTSSITIEFYSDGSVSCSSGSEQPIVLDYYCSSLSLSGCTESDACNYNPDATDDDGSCMHPGDSCDDFDFSTANDTLLDDCTCAGLTGGCTDVDACNFDANAETDNGSCVYPGDSCNDNDPLTDLDAYQDDCSCAGQGSGCTDGSAVNYDELAVVDDGSCCFNNSIEVILRDSFGDGGGSFTISDNMNNQVAFGALNNGFGPLGFTACVESGCFIFELTPDVFPMEISADIVVNNEIIFTHEDGDSFTQYPLVFNVGNDPDCVIYGCMDHTACNFSGLATEDDGSCDFEICVGCSSPGASNYSELVTTDDGSCVYDVSGVVFIDDNYNGIFDPFEEPLPYQTVTLEPGSIQVITGDDGEFSFTGLNEGEYQVSVNYTADWSNYTTSVTQSYVFPENGGQTVYFGVTNEDVPAPSACVDFYQWGFGVPCNDVLNYNICYRNMSPYAIDGVVEVVLDPLLSYNNSTPAADNVDGQTISWEFSNLGSWVMNFDDILVNTPDETHIGEFMTSTVTIYGWHEGELIPLTEQTITQEITCAYDPNDITGIPEGYTEDHFVLADTRMEYLIRFQNTGNAPATNVMVVDTLDVDMDPATFQLMANSHSVMTTIFPSGRIEFMFEDINLPDSTENEPESHGLVSFKIDFIDGVAVGEEINQTAHIFFDNNPAVVTNTTWHTIHQCGGEAAFTASNSEICVGESISFASEYEHVEDYQWNINSAPASNNESYEHLFTEEGDYIIQLISENPICQESTMQMISVHNLPESEITEDGAILTATDGTSYQWFLNGEAIYGATSQSYEAAEDGNYSVEVTNENNCSTTSEAVMIVSINELENDFISLYPNPMTDNATLEFSNSSIKTIRLLDVQGKLIQVWENVTDRQIIVQREDLESGKYFITVAQGESQKTIALIIR